MAQKFPLSGLGLQIKAHWKAHRPQMYRQLEEAGELDRSVYEAQRRTEEAFADQIEAGLPPGQAWEAVREEWAFLPAEPERPDALEDEGLGPGGVSLFEDETPNSEDGVAPPRVDTAAGSPTPSPMSAPPSNPRSSHPALLLLADLDGQLKPEFRDWDNDLLLEEGSLVPKWFPWEFEGQELSPEEREEQFRLNLDALLNVASRVTGRVPPTSPQRVLDCVIQLRSMFVSQ